jgi:hypothetical protein
MFQMLPYSVETSIKSVLWPNRKSQSMNQEQILFVAVVQSFARSQWHDKRSKPWRPRDSKKRKWSQLAKMKWWNGMVYADGKQSLSQDATAPCNDGRLSIHRLACLNFPARMTQLVTMTTSILDFLLGCALDNLKHLMLQYLLFH